MFAKWIRGKALAIHFERPIFELWWRKIAQRWSAILARAHLLRFARAKQHLTAGRIDAMKHWSEHKQQTSDTICNLQWFNLRWFRQYDFFSLHFLVAREKNDSFAIIRIQRLNESWKWAKSVPLSAFMYAICIHTQPQPEWRSGSAYLRSH